MNITGGESLSLFEAQEAADIVQDAADEDVNMILVQLSILNYKMKS